PLHSYSMLHPSYLPPQDLHSFPTRRSSDLAISFKVTISPSDSTLNIKIPDLSAYSISSFFLPTPENTIFFGSAPARKARNNSPPDTISKPPPSLAKALSNAMFEFAFTEKQT